MEVLHFDCSEFESAVRGTAGIRDVLLLHRCACSWLLDTALNFGDAGDWDEIGPGLLSTWQALDTQLDTVTVGLANSNLLAADVIAGATTRLCERFGVDVELGFKSPVSTEDCYQLYRFSRSSLLLLLTAALIEGCSEAVRLRMVGGLAAGLLDAPLLLAAARGTFADEFAGLPSTEDPNVLGRELSETLPGNSYRKHAIAVDLMSVFIDAQQRVALEMITAIDRQALDSLERVERIIESIIDFCCSEESRVLPIEGVSKADGSFNLFSLARYVRQGPTYQSLSTSGLATATVLPPEGRYSERLLFVIWHSSPDLILPSFSSEDVEAYRENPTDFFLAHLHQRSQSAAVARWTDYKRGGLAVLNSLLQDQERLKIAKLAASSGLVGLLAAGPVALGGAIGLPGQILTSAASSVGAFLLGLYQSKAQGSPPRSV